MNAFINKDLVPQPYILDAWNLYFRALQSYHQFRPSFDPSVFAVQHHSVASSVPIAVPMVLSWNSAARLHPPTAEEARLGASLFSRRQGQGRKRQEDEGSGPNRISFASGRRLLLTPEPPHKAHLVFQHPLPDGIVISYQVECEMTGSYRPAHLNQFRLR